MVSASGVLASAVVPASEVPTSTVPSSVSSGVGSVLYSGGLLCNKLHHITSSQYKGK